MSADPSTPPGERPCRSCGRPFSPDHDVSAPGPTVRHPYMPVQPDRVAAWTTAPMTVDALRAENEALRVERDALSVMLRGMARRTVRFHREAVSWLKQAIRADGEAIEARARVDAVRALADDAEREAKRNLVHGGGHLPAQVGVAALRAALDWPQRAVAALDGSAEAGGPTEGHQPCICGRRDMCRCAYDAEADTPAPAPLPRRDDHVAAWIKRARDARADGPSPRWDYLALDYLLDDYRLHADTGTPLDEHVCDGGQCDDCREGNIPAPAPELYVHDDRCCSECFDGRVSHVDPAEDCPSCAILAPGWARVADQPPAQPDTAALLRAAAAGRREYLPGCPAHVVEALEDEAAGLDAAADIAAGNYGHLYSWLPSWRWTPAMNARVTAGTSHLTTWADVAALAGSGTEEQRDA